MMDIKLLGGFGLQLNNSLMSNDLDYFSLLLAHLVYHMKDFLRFVGQLVLESFVLRNGVKQIASQGNILVFMYFNKQFYK